MEVVAGGTGYITVYYVLYVSIITSYISARKTEL
jgi:hypothetical protein